MVGMIKPDDQKEPDSCNKFSNQNFRINITEQYDRASNSRLKFNHAYCNVIE